MTAQPEKKKENDPMKKIIKQLEEYDEGTPPRKGVVSTWGE